MKAIAHLSDPHFGTEDPAVLAGLLDEIETSRPSLVALSGDLTQRATTAQFRAARDFLDRLTVPYLVVPGNHDVPLYDVVRRFFDPLGRYRHQITDDLAPSYLDDTFAVAGIATAHGFTLKGGRVTTAQLAAATASLAKATTQWRVIVAHHPFVGPERAEADLVEHREQGLVAFRHAGVQLILTGHLHISFSDDAAMRDEEHQMIAVHAGTCTSTRTRGEPNNYNRIMVDGDEVAVLVRMWNGTAFVDGEHKTYRRGAREIKKVL